MPRLVGFVQFDRLHKPCKTQSLGAPHFPRVSSIMVFESVSTAALSCSSRVPCPQTRASHVSQLSRLRPEPLLLFMCYPRGTLNEFARTNIPHHSGAPPPASTMYSLPNLALGLPSAAATSALPGRGIVSQEDLVAASDKVRALESALVGLCASKLMTTCTPPTPPPCHRSLALNVALGTPYRVPFDPSCCHLSPYICRKVRCDRLYPTCHR